MHKVAIIGCSKAKVQEACAAKNLYTSDFFKKAKTIAGQYHNWYILSAKYGLVHPDKSIEPYDLTLKDFSIKSIKNWSEAVALQMQTRIPKGSELHLYVFTPYHRYLKPLLEKAGYRVVLPIKGMTLFMAKHYLTKKVNELKNAQA